MEAPGRTASTHRNMVTGTRRPWRAPRRPAARRRHAAGGCLM